MTQDTFFQERPHTIFCTFTQNSIETIIPLQVFDFRTQLIYSDNTTMAFATKASSQLTLNTFVSQEVDFKCLLSPQKKDSLSPLPSYLQLLTACGFSKKPGDPTQFLFSQASTPDVSLFFQHAQTQYQISQLKISASFHFQNPFPFISFSALGLPKILASKKPTPDLPALPPFSKTLSCKINDALFSFYDATLHTNVQNSSLPLASKNTITQQFQTPYTQILIPHNQLSQKFLQDLQKPLQKKKISFSLAMTTSDTTNFLHSTLTLELPKAHLLQCQKETLQEISMLNTQFQALPTNLDTETISITFTTTT